MQSLINKKITKGIIMKILFIIPPITFNLRWNSDNTSYPPLGICAVAATIKEDHEVKILDANILKLSKRNILETIKTFNPKIIGISCNATIMRKTVYELCNSIKKQQDTTIIVGGNDASNNPESLLNECKSIDIVTYGEADFTVQDLLKNLSCLESVNGIVYRKENKIIKNSPREKIKNLDSLPFPAIELLPDIKKYHISFKYKRLPSINIITSRGCPHTCIFCAVKQSGYHYHSPKYVYEYMKYLREELGIKEVTIFDDNFALINSRVEQICDLIIENKLDITWSCLATIMSLQNNENLIKKMKQAGCWYIFFGLESANKQVLEKNNITKIPDLLTVKKVIGWCKKYKIQVKGSFIIGLPGDTESTIEETISFAKSLPLTAVNFSFPVPHPGSSFYDIAIQSGTFNHDDYENMSSHSSIPVYAPQGISLEWLKKRQKQAYKEYYFRPAFILRQVLSIKSFEDIKRYTKIGTLYAKKVFIHDF